MSVTCAHGVKMVVCAAVRRPPVSARLQQRVERSLARVLGADRRRRLFDDNSAADLAKVHGRARREAMALSNLEWDCDLTLGGDAPRHD
jgi:hypothetical protein